MRYGPVMFLTLTALPATARNERTTTAPEPRPLRAPVFVQDAVMPWQGETLLLALLRQQVQDQDE